MRKISIGVLLLVVLGTALYAQEQSRNIYPFAMEYRDGRTLLMTFNTPAGYERFPIGKTTRYMAWLTNLPLKPADHPLIRYDKRILMHSDSISGVIDVGITSNNQKAADMPLQLAMEYLKVVNEIDNFFFIIESGDSLNFNQWINGKFVKDARGKLLYKKGETREHSIGEFYKYIEFLMSRNTAVSLRNNLVITDQKEIIPGDIYLSIEDGRDDNKNFAAIILDVATDADGNIAVLTAMGGNPAQSIYLPKPDFESNRSWFKLDEFKKLMESHGDGKFYRFQKLINL